MVWKGSFLLPLAVPLLLGIFLGNLFEFFPLTLLFLFFIFIISTLLYLLIPLGLRYLSVFQREPYRKKFPGKLPLSLVIFCVTLGLGGIYIHWEKSQTVFDLSLLPSEREKVQVTGWVSSPVRHMKNRSVFLLQGEKIQGDQGEVKIRGKIKISIYDLDAQIHYGDRIQIRTRLKKPKGLVNPGGFNYQRYQIQHGIIASGSIRSAQDIKMLGLSGNPIIRKMAHFREHLRTAALSTLDGSDVAIFLAMILGERGGLTQEIREDFMASGTTHILSISGSHLGFVALVSFFLFRKLLMFLPVSAFLRMGIYCIPTQGAALFTLLPVTFYAFLAGGEVATLRALLMILLSMMAIFFQRAHSLFNTFAIAILAILLWNPQALFDISFQLSYLSVLIILLVIQEAPNDNEEEIPNAFQYTWSRVLDFTKKGCILSFAITLGTAPLVLLYFNQFPWVGVFSNLIISPLAGGVIVPLGLLTSVLSLVMDSPQLPLAGINHFFLSFFYDLVRFFSDIPGAEVYLPSPSAWWIALFYTFFFMTIAWKGRSLRRFLVGTSAVVLVMIWVAGNVWFHSTGHLRVTFLDVGQGDGAVIRFPDGEVMVVDAGRSWGNFDVGRLVMAPYLWNLGVRHIDYVLVTHPQLDHEGGIPYLLQKFSVGEVWVNGYQRDTEFHRRFKKVLREKKIPTLTVAQGKKLQVEDQTSLTILNPLQLIPAPPDSLSSRKLNNQSIVMRVQYGDHSFLFTGDIERRGEERLVKSGMILRSTVMKVPHHGSKGSLNAAFLEKVSPEIAVISVGGRNPYRHPAKRTLEAYESLSSEIFRTDQDGAIMIHSDGETLRSSRAVDLLWKPVKLGWGRWDEELENWKRIFTSSF